MSEATVDQKIVFQKALLALHQDIQGIKKAGKANPVFDSAYVKLPDMLAALKPSFKKHGFILSQPTDVASTQQGIVNVVISNITHADTGISDSAKLALTPEFIKSKDMQGLGGAITYARRYTLSALLGLEEIDDDGNKASGRSAKTSKVSDKDNF